MGLGLEHVRIDNFRETRTCQRNFSSRFIRNSRHNDVESLIRENYENLFNEMDELIPEYAVFTVFGRDESGEQLTIDYSYGQGTPLDTIVDDFENQIDGLSDDFGHIRLIDLDVEYPRS